MRNLGGRLTIDEPTDLEKQVNCLLCEWIGSLSALRQVPLTGIGGNHCGTDAHELICPNCQQIIGCMDKSQKELNGIGPHIVLYSHYENTGRKIAILIE